MFERCGIFVAVPDGGLKPAAGGGDVEGYAAAVVIHAREVVLRHGVVLYGGSFEPVGGFLRTVFHALAVVVNHAELRCGAAVVEFGGFKVEFARRGVVLLPADAFLISQCFLKGFFDVLEYQRGPFDVFVVVLVVQGGVAQELAAGGEAA